MSEIAWFRQFTAGLAVPHRNQGQAPKRANPKMLEDSL
jgi:hypothetical protein